LSVLVCLLFAYAASLASAEVSANKVLVMSDIHFNPLADPSLGTDLDAADPTQWEAILERSKLTRFSQYGEDTNWWLLRSALDQMQVTLPHPAFIMVPGDLLVHDFPKVYATATHDNDPEQYRTFVLRTLDFLALEFRKRFGDTKILVTPGNNDDECGDNSFEANGRFLRDTAHLARDVAQADRAFSTEWKALGSYSIPHPTIKDVRIISLNTVVFSYRYQPASFSQGCASVASDAGNEVLRWLESTLIAAKQNGEKVWLIFHVPPGIDGPATLHQYESLLKQAVSPTGTACSKAIVPMWAPAWTSEFDRLLENYRETVIASFAGHTHTDTFRLIGAGSSKKGFVLINPAISPISRNNPAFRVVSFNRDGSLADQSTYYLTNLQDASSTTSGRWKKEYQFSQEWKARQINGTTLGAIYEQIRDDEKSRDRWLKLYSGSSSAAQVSATNARGLYCAIGALDPKTYTACFCAGESSRSVAAGRP
jgi:hypothetical protein